MDSKSKMRQKSYNASSKIRVSGGDRVNRRRSRLPVDFEGGDSIPTLDKGRRMTSGKRDRSLDVTGHIRDAGGFALSRNAFKPGPSKKRRFRITRSAFDEPLHLDKSSRRIRSRFSDFFILGGIPMPRKRRDDDVDIHRNRMVFLAFTAGLAIYVLYKLLVAS